MVNSEANFLFKGLPQFPQNIGPVQNMVASSSTRIRQPDSSKRLFETQNGRGVCAAAAALAQSSVILGSLDEELP